MWAVLREHDDSPALATAGHSVGEYAAFHAAGSLTVPALMRLVDARGRAMARAGQDGRGAMAAIMGTLSADLEELCRQASADGRVVVPANFNAPEQVVVSGHDDAVERVLKLASEAGARKTMRLNVSGAFHSPLMLDAQSELSEALRTADLSDPLIPVYCNVTAGPCESGGEARELLDRQLASPVRWVELVQSIERDFPESVCLELGPGNVLASLVKRCAPSLKTLPCATARDLDAVARVLA
jgi:[acyl-carrier-protein] S-malonyltransferase